jgi:hypothetical protein
MNQSRLVWMEQPFVGTIPPRIGSNIVFYNNSLVQVGTVEQ